MKHIKLEDLKFLVDLVDSYKEPSNYIISITTFIDICITDSVTRLENSVRQNDDTYVNNRALLEGFIQEFITLYSILYSNNLITELQIFNIFNAKCYNKYTLKDVIFN